MVSKAVTNARIRRTNLAAGKLIEIDWMIDNVLSRVGVTLKRRVRLATELVKSRVVLNLAVPVGRSIGPRGGKLTERSQPGEFPRADTTQLMRTIFQVVDSPIKGVYDGMVGTPLDYGLILETRRNRSFLRRTLLDMTPTVKRILTGPIR